MSTNDPILRLHEAAKYLSISPVSLWRLHAQSRELEKPIKLGRGVKGYRRSTLDEYIEQRRTEA